MFRKELLTLYLNWSSANVFYEPKSTVNIEGFLFFMSRTTSCQSSLFLSLQTGKNRKSSELRKQNFPRFVPSFIRTSNTYDRVCHGFRFTTRDDYFRVNFDHFQIEHNFIRQLGQYWKSARAFKIQTATKLSLPKSVKLTVAFNI